MDLLRKDLFYYEKNKKEIEFICPKYKTIEYIPNDIVEFLDRSDQIGVDTSYPPRFDCEKCNGKMVPVYYVGANGTIYEYKNNLFFLIPRYFSHA